jgi:hypothetical protein
MSIGADQLGAETMVSCEGGRRPVGWIRVPLPLPVEVDRGVDGVFLLDERPSGPVYVAVR